MSEKKIVSTLDEWKKKGEYARWVKKKGEYARWVKKKGEYARWVKKKLWVR